MLSTRKARLRANVTPPLQLICTDFDGTIYAETDAPPVPEPLQARLARLQSRGAKWVVNTGRDLASLSERLRQARLRVQPDFLVLVEREIYVRNGSGFVPLEPWNTRCTQDHAALFARVGPEAPRLAAWVRARFDATVFADPWSPLCLLAKTNGDTDAIVAWLEDYCRQAPDLTVVRNDVYARFSHAAYNKGTALGEIARRLGVGPEHTLAAGDHFNDLPMLSLRYARWLMAPANAVPEVKSAVLRQLGRVSELPHGHGVEEVLAQWLAE